MYEPEYATPLKVVAICPTYVTTACCCWFQNVRANLTPCHKHCTVVVNLSQVHRYQYILIKTEGLALAPKANPLYLLQEYSLLSSHLVGEQLKVAIRRDKRDHTLTLYDCEMCVHVCVWIYVDTDSKEA